MGQDYMLFAYPGDVLSFLDDSVRTLEAAEQLAAVDGHTEKAAEIDETKSSLT
jgi:superfamily II helicase